MNTYGTRFRLTTYGESHGLAVGAIIDGCPAGVAIDMQAIDDALTRRRQRAPRQEEDHIEWLSGLKDGITLGTPIAFEIRNLNTRPEDYAQLEHMFRPGHADYTYYMKHGLRDHRGGGRASARETVARVVAGTIAHQLMPEVDIRCSAVYGQSAGDNDTVGGTVSCRITGVQAGLGDPVYGKLNAALAAAMMSIPSAIGFEMGAGFAAADMPGSEYIDRWNNEESPLTSTNHCGGIQGGISNGMPIEFRVAFHPVVTLPQPLECLHEDGHLETLNVGGRHDRCHVERTAVVVEAMAALCLINYML
ncbi:MAG: chorismate synthase [Bacteroidales bacterium]|nr:chorismate synthase [Bacteroidales bacterium]